MITQISLFAPNVEGSMHKITGILADNDINIISLQTNDSAEFGIVRLLVDKPEKAFEAYKKEGYLCRSDQVIGVYMVDKPGCLNRILSALSESRINIDYIYISFDRGSASPIAVMHASEPDIVEECLEAKGFRLSH